MAQEPFRFNLTIGVEMGTYALPELLSQLRCPHRVIFATERESKWNEWKLKRKISFQHLTYNSTKQCKVLLSERTNHNILFREVKDHRMAEPIILNSLSTSLMKNLPSLSAEDVVNKLRVIFKEQNVFFSLIPVSLPTLTTRTQHCKLIS